MFLDSEQPCIGITTIQNIKKGEVKNPYKPNSFNGYLGENQLFRSNNYKWLYRIWYNMIIRGEETNKEYYNKHRPDTTIYDNTIMIPEWLNYSNFTQWYMDNYNQRNHDIISEYVIDKDLLFRYYSKYTNGKKCYGPNYCELIPKDLNNKLSSYDVIERVIDTNNSLPHLSNNHTIKTIASFYYNNNCISEKAFHAILDL